MIGDSPSSQTRKFSPSLFKYDIVLEKRCEMRSLSDLGISLTGVISYTSLIDTVTVLYAIRLSYFLSVPV